ncbi:MAG: hypothetical protein PHE51_10065 [Eubacteriales bacterium]|nr:hypothetical protein [Eubacteriales bacterium]
MKIYNPSGVEVLDIIADDSSYRYRSIMSDDTLTLKFSVIEPISFPVGSYTDYQGVRYALWYPENFKKHNSRNFEYTLVLHSWREALKLYLYKDLSAKPYRVKFPLVATPAVFIQLLVDVLNLHDSGWVKGSVISSDEKLISFNHENCYDALNRIAQEFDTEWEIINKTIHLCRVEKFKDDPLALSYGKGNGFVSGVGRVNDGDRQPIGRMYVEGGERNIDFSRYGSKTLLLPKSASLLYNGKTYKTDEDGMYIYRDGNNNKAEGSYDGSKFYPKRVGTVSSVEVIDAEQNFYDIIDLTIPESLNYKECRIAGEKATIVFQSGVLAGREFDIEQTDDELTGYIHEERRFKIVPAEYDGYVMPGGVFVPKPGDKYAIFNISMPALYIRDDVTTTGASWDMFKEAVMVYAREEEQKFTFIGQVDGIWSKSKWLEIGGKIVPGGHILFSDEQFLPDGEVIRITGVKDYVNKLHKPEITLSNASIPASLGSVVDDLETDEVVIEESKKEAIRYTKRRWRDTKETMSMLQKSLLNFSSGINPITIQTMQLLVGDESLQFRFVNSKTAPSVVEHVVDFDIETKKFTANAGIIQHMTLGVNEIKASHKASDYKYWDMSAYESPTLEPDKSYYLYAKCSTSQNTGQFLLSESAIKMNAVPNYYHFLVGILNSEFDEVRSYVQMYGFTEILPGRITTDKIVSADGKTYIDLVNSIIGGKIRFLSNGIEKDLADWADSSLDNLDNTDQTITDLEDYVNNAFHDGIIDGAEAKAIETYINQIKSDKAGLEATYNKLIVNPILEGEAKSDLLNAKITFFGAVDNLTASINAVIADGKVTPSEKQSINAIFATYRSALASFATRIEQAKQYVEQVIKNIADDALNQSASAIATANIARAITDKFGTTIDGGLISTVITFLREFNSTTETAGLSGIQGSGKKDPAFWAGGTYDQAFGGTAKAIIRHDGSAKFTDADITGVINALNGGKIGGLSIIDGSLKSFYTESKAIWDYSKFPKEYVGESTASGRLTLSVNEFELDESYSYQMIPSTRNIRITPDGVSVKSATGIAWETEAKLVAGCLSIENTNTVTGITTLVEIFSDGIYFNGQKLTGGGSGYVLPTASQSTLGGVKVGSNLSIYNGVLSATNTTYDLASPASNGLRSYSDKTKLNGIATGANNYTHPSTHQAGMITTGTFQGIVTANNNTSYTTKQVRNMILSTGNAVSSQMANGDIWIKYE